MAKNKNELYVLRDTLERQNQQGKNMLEIVDKILGVEKRVDMKMRKFNLDMNEYKSDVEEMIEDIRDEVTISYEQQKELQSLVNIQANNFTKEYYDFGEVLSELFKKKKGQFITAQWKRLKNTFDVPRYTSIRKVDFDKAVNFLRNIELKDIDPSEIEDKRSWNIPGLFPDEEDA